MSGNSGEPVRDFFEIFEGYGWGESGLTIATSPGNEADSEGGEQAVPSGEDTIEEVLGNRGDVLTVDLSGTGYSHFEFPDVDENNSSGPPYTEYPTNHHYPANDLGYVARRGPDEILSLDGETFRDSGVFYFIPRGTGSRHLTIKATDGQNNTVTGVVMIRVTGVNSYSTSSGSEPVTFGNGANGSPSKLDRYRQQQRLRHFGFPNRVGEKLVVDGLEGPNTKHARGLFCSAVNNENHQSRESFENEESALEFINAQNAPRWVELAKTSEGGVGWVVNESTSGGPQPERWATTWAKEVLDEAGDRWDEVRRNETDIADDNDLAMQGATIKEGGSNLYHQTHEAGMDIDINISGTNNYAEVDRFYKTHSINGTLYVAAGDATIIVENEDGSYESVDIPDDLEDLPDGKDPLKHTDVTHLDDGHRYYRRTVFQDIKDLIVDADGYDLTRVREKIKAFVDYDNDAEASDPGVGWMYFNDPRTWDIDSETTLVDSNGDEHDRVAHLKMHGGHVHINIQPPQETE